MDGAAANPTAVTLGIKKPDTTVETLTPTSDSIGNYHYDYQPNQAGMYY